MKKTIQRSKVCVIGKLVRNLRDVKKKLEKQPNTLQLTGRTVKLTEQIDYLKRTGNVELATACLLNRRSAQQVVTNPMSTGPELALAHLCSFKLVADKCAAVKERLSLADDDDIWRKMIQEVGKKKQRKIKKETHLKRKAEVREVKDLQKKRSAWLEENIDVDELKSKGALNVDDDDSAAAAAEQPVEKKKRVADNVPPKTSAKTNASAAEKRIEKIAPSAPVPRTLKVDSFFVTSSGSNYMATAAIERHQPAGPNDGMDRRERRAQKLGGSTTRDRRSETSFVRRQHHAPPVAAAAPAALHPSWVAKQKSKGIEQFQGTKIKFGDTVSLPRQQANVVAPTKTPAEQDAAKLHPSWVAKQKLKPTISEFQGKKITFGDD